LSKKTNIFASHVGGLLVATGVSSFVLHYAGKCTKRSELQLLLFFQCMHADQVG